MPQKTYEDLERELAAANAALLDSHMFCTCNTPVSAKHAHDCAVTQHAAAIERARKGL